MNHHIFHTVGALSNLITKSIRIPYIWHLGLTCTLCQMISSVVSSFSSSSNEETSSELRQRRWSGNQETDNSLEDMIPNGIFKEKNYFFLQIWGKLN